MAQGIFLACALIGAGVAMAETMLTHDDSAFLLRARIPGLKTHELFVWRLDFRPGTSTSEHTHPSQEVLLVTKGQLLVKIGDSKTIANPGDVVFIPPGKPMIVRNLKTDSLSRALQFIVAKRHQHLPAGEKAK
jgi:quercetin dioxygenase-like cupin family protein